MVNLYLSPAEFFRSLPTNNRVAAAMVVLLIAHLLYASAVTSIGVIDYEAGKASQTSINRYAFEHGDMDPGALALKLDALEEYATFTILVQRVGLFLGGPLRLLLAIAVSAGVLFAMVALSGSKPDWSILVGIATFSAFVELPRMVVRLFLISQIQATRVETSAAAFVASDPAGLIEYLLLRRLDPFEWWYWTLIGLGVWKTQQLSQRAACTAAAALAGLAALVNCLTEAVQLVEINNVMAPFWH
jgi:hypothetical protein